LQPHPAHRLARCLRHRAPADRAADPVRGAPRRKVAGVAEGGLDTRRPTVGGEALDKVVSDVDAAVADVPDGATVLVGGFGGSGFPFALREALIRRRPKRITIVCNNADFGGFVYDEGL